MTKTIAFATLLILSVAAEQQSYHHGTVEQAAHRRDDSHQSFNYRQLETPHHEMSMPVRHHDERDSYQWPTVDHHERDSYQWPPVDQHHRSEQDHPLHPFSDNGRYYHRPERVQELHYYRERYNGEVELLEENKFGFKMPSFGSKAKSPAAGVKEGEMGSMDPAGMYFDPSMSKHGAAQMAVIPEPGAETQMGIKGITKGIGKAGEKLEKASGAVGQASEYAAYIPGAEQVASTLKGVADVGTVAAGLAQGRLPTADQSIAILKTIPGLGDVASIAEKVKKGADAAGQAMGIYEKTTKPDDGKPRSCWVKSHGRGFGRIPGGLFSRGGKTCKNGKELHQGLCYDPCPQGKGFGPVCWGSCPTSTYSCGVLCMLEGEQCGKFIGKVTKDVIATGIRGVGQDYLGAVKGALDVAEDLAYPICSTMNEIDDDYLFEDQHINDIFGAHQKQEIEHEDNPRYYDNYFLQ